MRWIVSGGGTGGHFFPALEVAKYLEELGDEVLFVGVRRGIEAKLAPKYGLRIAFIPFEGVRGRGIRAAVALIKLPFSLFKAVSLLRRFKADAVFSTGGYAAFPVALAAKVVGIPLFIHEQNSVPGWSNLLLARFAREVWISFEESASFFKGVRRVIHTGNIVRRSIREIPFVMPPVRGFILLVFGGSSGARTINRAVCEALSAFKMLGVKLVHQVGALDIEWVREEYIRAGFSSSPVEFIEDMGWAYRRASLVICRAGATTLFELVCVGRAAILVPYPFAVGDHQRLNALSLKKRRSAVLLDNSLCSGEELIKRVVRFFFNRRLVVGVALKIYRALRVCDLEDLKRIRDEVSVH